MQRINLPRLVKWMLWTGLVLLFVMTIMRFGLYLGFNRQGNALAQLWPAFWLGLRYDLRTVSAILMLMLLLGSIPPLNPFGASAARNFWRFLMPALVIVMVFFYVVDFAHYAYLVQRLNASVLNYLQDAGISMTMVWQSYPVVWLLLGILAFSWLVNYLLRQGHKRIGQNGQKTGKRARIISFAIAFLLLGFFIFGRLNQYPLRWSDAFSLGSDYKANLALNPFESFFNTLQFRRSSYDEKEVRNHFPLMARFLGLPANNTGNLDFERRIVPVPDSNVSKPNVVLVICESFSAYKSSMWGNPLNTTPFFDSLCRNGLFFDHCFTPTYGTARGVWATVTGIPDVEMPTTASRNPLAVDQRTIINDFDGYEKYYFIGGSPSWANIRGLLMNNISGLHLYEEGNMNAPKLDVWGISDKNLFLQANKVLSQTREPFFAIIQTADNHRPYSIPEEDQQEFKPVQVPDDSLKKFGFEKLEEMNAFRYTDFCFEKFFRAAGQQSYFRNTIFVFVGDHGIPGNAESMFPKAWTEQRLTAEHVPLLFYSPGRLDARRFNRICSQVDILPTVAGICRIPYTNTTMGRDLLDSNLRRQAAFIFDPEFGQRGVIENGFFYREQMRTGKQEIVSVLPDAMAAKQVDPASARDSMQQLSRAIYETSRYMLLNNKKKGLQAH